MCQYVSMAGDLAVEELTVDGGQMTRYQTKKSKLKRVLGEVCKNMPALSHWPDREQPFSVDRSEVCQWLASHPMIKQLLYDAARESGAIVYDADTRTWRGKGNG